MVIIFSLKIFLKDQDGNFGNNMIIDLALLNMRLGNFTKTKRKNLKIKIII